MRSGIVGSKPSWRIATTHKSTSGAPGLCWRQFNDPVRVVAFNTLEHWSEDVSEYIAFEIQTRCDIDGIAVPEHIRDFTTGFAGAARQLALRLV